MKRALLSSSVLAAVLLGGCSQFGSKMEPARAPVASARPAPPALVDANGTPIERVPFRTGVSSATVEKLGKRQGCTSAQGAGLVTEAGPVEVYRMRCEDGKVFMARCELRQCVRM